MSEPQTWYSQKDLKIIDFWKRAKSWLSHPFLWVQGLGWVHPCFPYTLTQDLPMFSCCWLQCTCQEPLAFLSSLFCVKKSPLQRLVPRIWSSYLAPVSHHDGFLQLLPRKATKHVSGAEATQQAAKRVYRCVSRKTQIQHSTWPKCTVL